MAGWVWDAHLIDEELKVQRDSVPCHRCLSSRALSWLPLPQTPLPSRLFFHLRDFTANQPLMGSRQGRASIPNKERWFWLDLRSPSPEVKILDHSLIRTNVFRAGSMKPTIGSAPVLGNLVFLVNIALGPHWLLSCSLVIYSSGLPGVVRWPPGHTGTVIDAGTKNCLTM